MELHTVTFGGQTLDSFLSEPPQPSPVSTHSQSSLASDLILVSSADSYLYGPLAGPLSSSSNRHHPRSSADLYPYGWLPPEPPWLNFGTPFEETIMSEVEMSSVTKRLITGSDADEELAKTSFIARPSKIYIWTLKKVCRDWRTSWAEIG